MKACKYDMITPCSDCGHCNANDKGRNGKTNGKACRRSRDTEQSPAKYTKQMITKIEVEKVVGKITERVSIEGKLNLKDTFVLIDFMQNDKASNKELKKERKNEH